MRESTPLKGLLLGPAKFARIIVRACYRIIKPLAGAIVWKSAAKYRTVRSLAFDTAPPKSLLLSTIGEESYVVSSDDKVIGRDIYMTGSFDFGKLKKSAQFLGPDWSSDLLIDIGSNIGVICIPAVKRGLFRSAIAIEPEPFNYRLLCTNIQLNGLG